MTNSSSYFDEYHYIGINNNHAPQSEFFAMDELYVKSSHDDNFPPAVDANQQNSWLQQLAYTTGSTESSLLMKSLIAGVDKEKVKRKKQRRSPKVTWKKPEGMPKRPLSAYNLFFRSERERLLLDIIPTSQQKSSITVPKQSNKRTKSGIGFAGLAQQIASKWKMLDTESKKVFQDQAFEEKQRYKKEVEIWKKEKARKEVEDQKKKAKKKKKKQDLRKPTLTPLEEGSQQNVSQDKALSSSPLPSLDCVNWVGTVSLDQGVDDNHVSETGSIHEIKPTFPPKRYHSDSILELQAAVYKNISYEETEIDFDNVFEQEPDFQNESTNLSMSSSSLLTLAKSLDDESFQFIVALKQDE